MSIKDIPLATAEDIAAIDRLINPGPPERIYGWLNTQLSIARHYGSMTYQGQHYQIDYHTKGEPLVRADVLAREAKVREELRKKIDAETKRLSKLAQGDLMPDLFEGVNSEVSG